MKNEAARCGAPSLSRRHWTLARYLAGRSPAPFPPIARPGDDALHVAKLMVTDMLPRSVYVIAEDGRYLGVIRSAAFTREVFRHLDAGATGDGFGPGLQRFVECEARVLDADDSLVDAMRALLTADTDELPVVDGSGRLVGVVRTLDVLREWIDDSTPSSLR